MMISGCATWKTMSTSDKWQAVSKYYHEFVIGLEKGSGPVLDVVAVLFPKAAGAIEAAVKPTIAKVSAELDKLDTLISAKASDEAIQAQAQAVHDATVNANANIGAAKAIAEQAQANPTQTTGAPSPAPVPAN